MRRSVTTDNTTPSMAVDECAQMRLIVYTRNAERGESGRLKGKTDQFCALEVGSKDVWLDAFASRLILDGTYLVDAHVFEKHGNKFG